MEIISQHKCFEGYWQRLQHFSESCQSTMTFSVYLPEQSEQATKGLFWLSGLTCNDENFVHKSHVEQAARKYHMVIIVPDTSPRACDIEGEEDSWDFGSGAGFFLNATREPWAQHYQMYDYLIMELYPLVIERFHLNADSVGISGHSMGGHGALTLGLKHSDLFRSISAFAPIAAPTRCPWGEKAFTGYLGDDRTLWQAYDSCELIKQGYSAEHLLVDVGTEDSFLQEQLKPELLQQVCEEKGLPLTLNFRSGYDHSYFFVASFIEDHIEYHAKRLDGLRS